MSITLHGDTGLIVALLAILGAAWMLTGIENWVLERIKIDLNPLWHVIPRRFKVRRRWDRPGAVVEFGNGRHGFILSVCEADDVDQVLLIQPCTADLDEDDGDPEWVACSAVDGEWKSLTDPLRAPGDESA